MYFFTDKSYFRIDEQLNSFTKKYQNCSLDINKCLVDEDFIVKKNYGKLIIIKNRN